MNDKTTITCFACEGEEKRMTNEEAVLKLKTLNSKEPLWEIKENSLILELKFKNYKQALDFVNNVSTIAEQMKHHPDISFGWGYCKLTILTHKVDGLTAHDFNLAEETSNFIREKLV